MEMDDKERAAMEDKELCESLGITQETLDRWTYEAEEGIDDGGWGPWIKIRDFTAEEQKALDCAIAFRDRIDKLKEATGMSETEAEIKMDAIIKAEEAAAAKSKAESKEAVTSR
ncbi:hypothetical protein OZX72_07780 [Bifidobacterium sp. ESL0769]|uniref:hypothetical protein n=1 Tax=Bifidobacterium sp. ESL0769 TaxID=2983229 RepID=UPI0023F6762A|nr:hypothetical protein [Bifidobacterium sp. ESL0769]WEV67131.1 hypothetical protein OZX72_07780 [Bifidobacterium sp. ESL0769]